MKHDDPRNGRTEDRSVGGPPAESKTAEDWRDLFYLNAFLDLSLSSRQIQRREQVWIKRFLANRGKPNLYRRMEEIIRGGSCNVEEFHHLIVRAAAELSMGEKRRFIYNLAQLFEARGSLSTSEYERTLDLAEKLGVPDTETDAVLHSVHRINDTFIAIMGLLACGTIIYLTRSVIIPLVVSIFITMIIHRIDSVIASALKLRRLRWFNKLAAMVLILAVLFGLVTAATFSAMDISNRYSGYQTSFETALRKSGTAQSALSWLDKKGVLAQMKHLPVGGMVSDFLASLVNLLSNFVLVVIFTIFLVFSPSVFTGVMAEMSKTIGTYISIKSMICLGTGLLVYLLCWVFGVDFALFWALLAFLLNFIPTVGAIIASLPPILLSIAQLESTTAIVFFVLIMTLANVLIGQFVEPKLMGTHLATKPVAILLGLVFWGLLWGIPGMFLATPLMVLIRILSSYFSFSRSLERLLATDTT